MTKEINMGIDPGASGGIVIIAPKEAKAVKMPATERDVWQVFVGCATRHWDKRMHAYIEHVHSMPAQGVKSTFTFGRNYGMLRGFLIAAEIPFEEVSPAKWQRYWGLPTLKECGDSKTVKKNKHKAKAQQLFPSIKMTHALADACLIAEYGRRIRSKRDN